MSETGVFVGIRRKMIGVLRVLIGYEMMGFLVHCCMLWLA